MNFQTAALVAFVMVLRIPFSITKPRIDQDVMRAGVHIVALDGVPIFLSHRALPKDIGAKVSLQPASVNWVNLGFCNAHLDLRI